LHQRKNDSTKETPVRTIERQHLRLSKKNGGNGVCVRGAAARGGGNSITKIQKRFALTCSPFETVKNKTCHGISDVFGALHGVSTARHQVYPACQVDGFPKLK
ncbi:unnamed protein product, partial [Ectocarpus sp. 8 AP-2014]